MYVSLTEILDDAPFPCPITSDFPDPASRSTYPPLDRSAGAVLDEAKLESSNRESRFHPVGSEPPISGDKHCELACRGPMIR